MHELGSPGHPRQGTPGGVAPPSTSCTCAVSRTATGTGSAISPEVRTRLSYLDLAWVSTRSGSTRGTHVADVRCRLRHLRLPQHRSGLRHARGRLTRSSPKRTRPASGSSSTWSRTIAPTSIRGSRLRCPPLLDPLSGPGSGSGPAAAGRRASPNGWQSIFGGPAWTRITEEVTGGRVSGTCICSRRSKPDFNWANPDVRAEFEEVLRFLGSSAAPTASGSTSARA